MLTISPPHNTNSLFPRFQAITTSAYSNIQDSCESSKRFRKNRLFERKESRQPRHCSWLPSPYPRIDIDDLVCQSRCHFEKSTESALIKNTWSAMHTGTCTRGCEFCTSERNCRLLVSERRERERERERERGAVLSRLNEASLRLDLIFRGAEESLRRSQSCR